jgi:hypothetical protein
VNGILSTEVILYNKIDNNYIQITEPTILTSYYKFYESNESENDYSKINGLLFESVNDSPLTVKLKYITTLRNNV